MVLRQMQDLIAHCYDAPSDYDIYDFLATDRSQVDLSPRCSDEQVLVADNDTDGARISVFIDSDVLARLADRDPLTQLDQHNLADYCTALEGVSHFQYLTWRISRRLPVSLLELELQAEVDKYVGAMILLTRQRSGAYPQHLHRLLFDRVSFVDGIDAESIARYRLANRNAAAYCRKLDERFLRSRCRPEAWLAELRRFYRYGHAEKVRRAGE